MPLELTIQEGGGPARRQVLAKDVVFLGRREDNDVVLPYSFVSARHGRLFRREGALYVEDMGSTNGTLVNEQPLTPLVARALGPDDLVKVGEIVLQARWTEGGGADDAEALTYHELPRPAALATSPDAADNPAATACRRPNWRMGLINSPKIIRTRGMVAKSRELRKEASSSMTSLR